MNPLPTDVLARMTRWHRLVVVHADVGGSSPRRLLDLQRFSSPALRFRTGRTARAVADLLGHVDASLVLRRYAHTLPDELSNAAEDLDRWRAEHRY